MRLVFLWRGLLKTELRERIERLGLDARVDVIDGKADVPSVMAGVHAAVVLADSAKVVRAYPHSLLEALAAGRPVLVSRCMGLADDVEAAGCGVVVDDLSAGTVVAGVERLQAGCADYGAPARALATSRFSLTRFLNDWETLYAEALKSFKR